MDQTIREIRKRARFLAAPLLGSLALVYLIYLGIQGDRGLLAWIQRGQDIFVAEQRLAGLQIQADALAHRITLMHPKSLDLDLLEERVRAVLNLAGPDDIILLETQLGD